MNNESFQIVVIFTFLTLAFFFAVFHVGYVPSIFSTESRKIDSYKNQINKRLENIFDMIHTLSPIYREQNYYFDYSESILLHLSLITMTHVSYIYSRLYNGKKSKTYKTCEFLSSYLYEIMIQLQDLNIYLNSLEQIEDIGANANKETIAQLFCLIDKKCNSIENLYVKVDKIYGSV